VTSPAQVIGDVQIEFPAYITTPDVEVILTLHVGSTGNVAHVDVESPDAPREFAQAAARAFALARFEPARIDGRPVTTQVRVAVRFEGSVAPLLAGAGDPASGTLYPNAE
jgi:TonB family protein